MKVLVIDDKSEQLALAKDAAERMGWEAIAENPTTEGDLRWHKLMESADGVVTDLIWCGPDCGPKPSGLLVVIHALSLGKPVVICTDGTEYPGGHHGDAIGFINDGYRTSVRSNCPFGWEERKDWNRAMKLLAERLNK